MTKEERQFVVKKIKKHQSDNKQYNKRENLLILSLLSFTSVIASSYPTNGEILREMSIILGIFGIGMSLFLLGCNAGAMSESKEQIKELIELLENDNGLGSR